MRKLHVALIYNSFSVEGEDPEDRGGTWDLRVMIRSMARRIRSLGHKVTVVPLAYELMAFQRKLRRLQPDVVFNQYDDVVHGALYEMRVAALVRMMGFPITGAGALALGLCRYKYMANSLLQGAGVPIPPCTHLIERASEVDLYKWNFPVIVQAAQEHAGIGLDRDSVVTSKTRLREKVREILRDFKQPALAQHFLPGREFNVSVVGGHRMRVLPFSEVDYSRLPEGIPPIMSYAAKWMENTAEYKNTRAICPAEVNPELARRMSGICIRAFRAVGGWGYGRVDVRLDEHGDPKVLEVNCNSSLDEDVALARSAKAAGIEYPQLLQLIINSALERPPFDVDVPMI